jgi:hypothetical protein
MPSAARSVELSIEAIHASLRLLAVTTPYPSAPSGPSLPGAAWTLPPVDETTEGVAPAH